MSERVCKICKQPISGKSNKLTCGVACRKQWFKISQQRKMNNLLCGLID